jgi:hypothetical protein
MDSEGFAALMTISQIFDCYPLENSSLPGSFMLCFFQVVNISQSEVADVQQHGKTTGS